MLGFMNKFQDLDEPPQLKSYLQRRLEAQYRIEEGKPVMFKRDGYSFSNGIVSKMHLSMNAALVTWQDEQGWTHQAICGLEFLRRAENKTPRVQAGRFVQQ